jgi:hypothetical protein
LIMHLVFVIAFTHNRVVPVTHRVSVSYEDLLLSGLYMTSYKRPSVCPGVIKTLTWTSKRPFSIPTSDSFQGIATRNICELTLSPWISNLKFTEYLENAGKSWLQFMSLHLFCRMVGGGLSVITAIQSSVYSFTSHPHTGTFSPFLQATKALRESKVIVLLCF